MLLYISTELRSASLILYGTHKEAVSSYRDIEAVVCKNHEGDFNKNNTKTNHIAWYVIVLIILSVLIIIMFVILIYTKRRQISTCLSCPRNNGENLNSPEMHEMIQNHV